MFSGDEKIKKHYLVIFLALILLTAFFLRSLKLNDSFFDENEAYNLSDIYGYVKALKALPLISDGKKKEYFEFISAINEKSEIGLPLLHPAFTSLPTRPGYPAIVAVTSCLTGFNDTIGKHVNSILGVVSILIVFLFGTKLYSVRAGLIGALLLTFSLYHIAFSRSGLDHILTSLCVTASFYFHYVSVKSNKLHSIFLSGIFFGYAICSHIVSISFLPILLFLEFLLILSNKKFADSLFRLTVLFVGLALPLFAFQSLSLLIETHQKTGYTFLTGLWAYLTYNVGSPEKYYSYTQPLNFLIFYIDSESAISFALIAAWILTFLRKNSFSSLISKLRKFDINITEYYLEIILVLYAIIWLHGSITNANHYPPRAFMYCITFFCLWLGGIYNSLLERHKKEFIAFLLVIFVMTQAARCWKIIVFQSGYREAADYVLNNSEKPGICTISDRSIYKYYIKDVIIRRPKRAADLLKFNQNDGVKYFIAEWNAQWFSNTKNDFYEFEKEHTPEKIVENPYYGYLPYMAQAYCYPLDYLSMLKKPGKIQTLRIYNLDRIFAAEKDRIPE